MAEDVNADMESRRPPSLQCVRGVPSPARRESGRRVGALCDAGEGKETMEQRRGRRGGESRGVIKNACISFVLDLNQSNRSDIYGA